MEKMLPTNKRTLNPDRFEPSRAILMFDRFMNRFINVGGLVVVTAVLGIFVFILIQIIPLFIGAQVHEVRALPLPKADYSMIGTDEGALLPFAVRSDGKLVFVDVAGGGGTQEIDPGFAASVSTDSSV